MPLGAEHGQTRVACLQLRDAGARPRDEGHARVSNAERVWWARRPGARRCGRRLRGTLSDALGTGGSRIDSSRRLHRGRLCGAVRRGLRRGRHRKRKPGRRARVPGRRASMPGRRARVPGRRAPLRDGLHRSRHGSRQLRRMRRSVPGRPSVCGRTLRVLLRYGARRVPRRVPRPEHRPRELWRLRHHVRSGHGLLRGDLRSRVRRRNGALR
jgi:hypothetical protein